MVSEAVDELYRASEFARLAGVTVRALHHYDQLGLLKPTRRTAAGYRLYGEGDFARLQQIVTLKFIGFPLGRIKDLLGRGEFDLGAALRTQREVLVEKGRRLARAVRAIEEAEAALAQGAGPGRAAFAKIIEVIEMQNNTDWLMSYYSEEAQEKIKERAEALGPEGLERSQRDWAALIAEVSAAAREGVAPESERAQSLAARWQSLVEAFTGKDPEVEAGLRKLYTDEGNWPSTFRKPYGDDAGAFIAAARAARSEEG